MDRSSSAAFDSEDALERVVSAARNELCEVKDRDRDALGGRGIGVETLGAQRALQESSSESEVSVLCAVWEVDQRPLPPRFQGSSVMRGVCGACWLDVQSRWCEGGDRIGGDNDADSECPKADDCVDSGGKVRGFRKGWYAMRFLGLFDVCSNAQRCLRNVLVIRERG